MVITSLATSIALRKPPLYKSNYSTCEPKFLTFFLVVLLISINHGLCILLTDERAATLLVNRSRQQDLFNLMGVIYAAVFFLGATNANTVQPVVAIERTVFYRERASGLYSSLAYAFAQVSIETIYISVQSFVYSLILFSMIDFGWSAGKFFWFFFLTFMCFIYFTLYGMMAVALTPSYQVAGIVSSFFYSFWNLFCGFVIPRKMMPVWWRWMFWANPVSWTIYGLVVSQLGELDNSVEIPGEASLDVKTFLKLKLGYEHDLLGYVALVHLVFVFVFTFVFAYSIKFLNFQKR